MDKLLPLLALIVTASISVSRSAMAEWWFAAPLSSSFATDVAGPDAALVLVAGKGGGTTGGMGGGTTTGGMGGGATTGGLGGGATTGGMGGGATPGGMGGGATPGGMGGGAPTGGMGGGTMTGGMGGGAATGGMGGGTFGGGMFNNPAAGFGTNNSSGWPDNSAQPSYYTYQCVTPSGQCSFVAPVTLRASSLRAGARCSCSDGLSQGQVK